MKRFTLLLIVLFPLGGIWLLLGVLADDTLAIDVSGDISTDTVWTLADSPVVITDTLTLLPGTTLTIEAGVEVRAHDNTGLAIEGHLHTMGTPSQPVTFTSVAQTNYDDWFGINIYADGSSNMANTKIQFAAIALDIQGESHNVVNLFNSHIQNNALAMHVTPNAWHRLHMDNVTFENNLSNRVLIDTYYSGTLIDDISLTPQPGLDAYEILTSTANHSFDISSGATMTLAPGTNLIVQPRLSNLGNLQATGTLTNRTFITLTNGLSIYGDGLTYLAYTTLSGDSTSQSWGLNLYGLTSAQVVLEQTTLQHFDLPLVVDVGALHRLTLDQTTFINNLRNRVFLDTYNGFSLFDDVVLRAQPGLEGYEVTKESSPVPFKIPSGLTLTLEAGANLFFQEAQYFDISGGLRTSGTAQLPIRLTTAVSNTTWTGMQLNSGQAQLNHVILDQAETGISLNNSVTNSLTLNNSQIIGSSEDGLAVTEGTILATCTTFGQNGRHGLYVNGSNPHISIQHSNLIQNGVSGISNNGPTTVTAIHNWWGDNSGPGGEGPGIGDEIFGDVSYDPWLNSPGCEGIEWIIYLPYMTKP